MKVFLVGMAFGIGSLGSLGSGHAQESPLHAPRDARAEPGTPESAALSTRAAKAELAGNFPMAVQLADQAIASDPRDPWPHYDKASALVQMGKTDEAVANFRVAEQRFANVDRWGQSISIYGRAHAFSEGNRCDEARASYREYAAFVQKVDPKSAEMALRYAADCHAPAPSPTPPAPSGPR